MKCPLQRGNIFYLILSYIQQIRSRRLWNYFGIYMKTLVLKLNHGLCYFFVCGNRDTAIWVYKSINEGIYSVNYFSHQLTRNGLFNNQAQIRISPFPHKTERQQATLKRSMSNGKPIQMKSQILTEVEEIVAELKIAHHEQFLLLLLCSLNSYVT